MRGTLVTGLLLALACGSTPPPTDPESPPPAEDPPEKPAAPRSPELVMIPDTTELPDDCIAEGPSDGLLDRTSPFFSRIEIKKNKQQIIEKATAADDSFTVTAIIGGCAHFGASYQLEYASAHPITDAAHHYKAALEVLAKLPVRAQDESYIDGISKNMNKVLADPALLEQCVIADGEMVNVYCGIAAPSAGRVSVSLTYDIVL